MDKSSDYNYFGMPPYGPGGMGMYDMSGMGADYSFNNGTNGSMGGTMDSSAMFNPLMQYEQAYMYYRYLSMQMEYKIKCKEYEKLVSKPENSRESGRKIE